MLTRSDLKLPLPDGWVIVNGVDTGTYMSAVVSAFSPKPHVQFVLDEFPNYHYVGDGEIELLGMTVSEWARWALDGMLFYQRHLGRTSVHAWADSNTQFRAELSHHGIHLLANSRKLKVRTEVGREDLHAEDPSTHDRQNCFLAPWLRVLPYELEMARFRDDETGEREKENDHTLDCFEHNSSRRPRGKSVVRKKKEPWLHEHLRTNRWNIPRQFDTHLGRN